MAVPRRDVEAPRALVEHAKELEKEVKIRCESIEGDIRILESQIARLERNLADERKVLEWAKQIQSTCPTPTRRFF
jgi:hypothetical protein